MKEEKWVRECDLDTFLKQVQPAYRHAKKRLRNEEKAQKQQEEVQRKAAILEKLCTMAKKENIDRMEAYRKLPFEDRFIALSSSKHLPIGLCCNDDCWYGNNHDRGPPSYFQIRFSLPDGVLVCDVCLDNDFNEEDWVDGDLFSDKDDE
jgi:hypothetical protein